MAAVLVGISGLTDMFDGKVARKFNMITGAWEVYRPAGGQADAGSAGALLSPSVTR